MTKFSVEAFLQLYWVAQEQYEAPNYDITLLILKRVLDTISEIWTPLYSEKDASSLYPVSLRAIKSDTTLNTYRSMHIYICTCIYTIPHLTPF